MKEIFIQQRDEEISNMSDAEYQDYIKSQEECECNDDCPCKEESATQDQVETNHDAWWDSLTDEQKQQLYDSKEALFELTIEEMNHDLNFGK